MTDNSINRPADSPLNALYGENPLLLPLGPRIAFTDLPAKLTNSALTGFDLTGLNPTAKEDLLLLQKQNFTPTAVAIDIAAALQNLHRETYWQRHPRNPTALRDRALIAQLASSPDADQRSMPWLNTFASGMIIKGITGLGKTSITNRYTSMLNAQVHEHTNGEIPGLDYVRQIGWLKVDMSSDGSREGFLTSILHEIDRLINTDYARQYSSGRFSVDKLAVKVGAMLSIHLCGLLIIEEIQEKNFNNSRFRNDLTTFFLRILNFGIPVVLIGNPLGFTELEKSSQDTRRLSSGGVFEILPSLDGSDPDFQYLVGQTLLFNVMECQNVEGREYFREMAYTYSGGVTDFVVRLNVESQLIALRRGEKAVLPKHIDAAFACPRLSPNHKLIKGLVNKEPNLLRECNDVPVSRFEELWQEDEQRKKIRQLKASKSAKNSSPKDIIESVAETEVGQACGARVSTDTHQEGPTTEHPLMRKFKAEQTRQAKKHKKAIDQKDRLSPKDIRGEGASASLVAGLNELLKKRQT